MTYDSMALLLTMGTVFPRAPPRNDHCYKSRMTGQPDYLAAELRSYQPQLSLRSSSQELLTVSHCKTMLGRRRFSVAAPRVWNNLKPV